MHDGCQGEVPEAEAPETPWEGGGGREVSKDESSGSPTPLPKVAVLQKTLFVVLCIIFPDASTAGHSLSIVPSLWPHVGR